MRPLDSGQRRKAITSDPHARRDPDVFMGEKPRLIFTKLSRGKAIACQCSLCGQVFLLPEDKPPKEAAAEMIAAFAEHVREEHPNET